MAGINADTLSFFQIKITYEQAQHLPGAIIIDYFSKAEMIFGLGGDRVISRVEFDDPKCLEELANTSACRIWRHGTENM